MGCCPECTHSTLHAVSCDHKLVLECFDLQGTSAVVHRSKHTYVAYQPLPVVQTLKGTACRQESQLLLGPIGQSYQHNLYPTLQRASEDHFATIVTPCLKGNDLAYCLNIRGNRL